MEEEAKDIHIYEGGKSGGFGGKGECHSLL